MQGRLNNFLKAYCKWIKVSGIRQRADNIEYADGEFVIDLFKAIDEDLEQVNKRLLFLDLGWDSYVYTALDQSSVQKIIEKYGSLFHGTENLRM